MSAKKSYTTKIIIALVVIALGVGAYFLFRKKGKDTVIFEPAKIERGNVDVKILATGTVQPENRLDIKPPIAGRAEKVIVQEGELVKKSQILAWMSSSERAAMIDAASAQGPAELRRWEDMYRATPVIAPIDGTIIQRNVEPGQTFVASDSIFVMSDRLIVEALVDETDIAKIKLKDTTEIVLDAYPKNVIPAIVRQVAFEAKTVNNVTSYIVQVLPDLVPDFMRSGMTANITFFVDSRRDVLLIPNEAIKYVDGKPKALLTINKQPPQQTDIEIGLSDGRITELKSGLNEGDTVLIERVISAEEEKEATPFGGMPRRGGGRSRR